MVSMPTIWTQWSMLRPHDDITPPMYEFHCEASTQIDSGPVALTYVAIAFSFETRPDTRVKPSTFTTGCDSLSGAHDPVPPVACERSG